MKKIGFLFFAAVLISISVVLIIIRLSLFLLISSIGLWLALIFFVGLKIGFFDKIKSKFRNIHYTRISGNKSAKNLVVGDNVILRNPECVFFGDNVKIGHDAEFYPLTNYHGKTFKPKIIVGNGTIIGDYNRFACQDEVLIEDNVLFAAYVHITDHSHEYRDIDCSISSQGTFSKGPVKIGEGTWIGIRCSILSGVTIGKHCIVAAGSVVTHDIPSYSVVAGAPARIIKQYDFKNKKWENAA